MDYEPHIGDLVWAKMKGYSPWPARVVRPGPNLRKQHKKGHHWIYFFGSNNYAWIEERHIKPYEEFKAQFTDLCKTAPFKEACNDIEEFITKSQADPNYDSVFDSLLQADAEEKQGQSQQTTPQQSQSSQSLSTSTTTTTTQPTPKKPRKSTAVKRQSSEGSTKASSAKKARTSPQPQKFSENGAPEPFDDELLNLPPELSKPVSPHVDLNNISDDMKNKDISASTSVFGFMGLGNMGSSVVKNLINSGHTVNLWNRSPQKCDDIKAQADANQLGLVQTYLSPYDIILNSDIVFSCVSDSRAVKEIVIGKWGVIHQADGSNALQGKGYVEMTSIDPDTSKDISSIIKGKGGRYLEAQMQGSKKQAEDGRLIILAAGDRSLFDDCQSCFKAMGRTAFYLGNVGAGIKMNLCINMTLGISLAGFAESMVLAERCGLSSKDFMEIFTACEGASNFLVNKGNLILNRGFSKVEQALEYMQKDMKFCLDISNVFKQNLPVAATANEAYKTSRRAGYDGHDVSIVFFKLKH